MKSTVSTRLMKTTLLVISPVGLEDITKKLSQFPWLHKSEPSESKDVSIYKQILLQNKVKRVVRRSERQLFIKQLEEDRLSLQKIE